MALYQGIERKYFNSTVKLPLMPDFWDDRDGYHELKDDDQFYLDVQKALNKELHVHQKKD